MNGERGYTIVEVMIFLAVSTALFAGAMIAIGGQQSKVRFSQSMRDIESKTQDVINDVSTGFFPTVRSLKCQKPSGGSTMLTLTSDSATPNGDIGQNQDCVLLGKVLHFSPNGLSDQLYTYSVVGLRASGTTTYYNSLGSNFDKLAESISEALPTLAVNNDKSVDLTTRETLRWGVRLKRVINGATMFGVYSSLTGSELTGQERELDKDKVFYKLKSGSQVAQAIDFSSRLKPSGANFSGAESTSLSEDDVKAIISGEAELGYGLSRPYVLCFESGDGNQEATLTFGQSGRSISTTLEFRNCPP